VTVSVWAKTRDLSGPPTSNAGLWLDVLMGDGSYDFGKTAPAPAGTNDWQELKVIVGGAKPVQAVNVYLLLRTEHTGTVWFDDLSVTTASQPGRNLAANPGYEAAGVPPKAIFLRDNAMFDEADHERWFADTWGGADVGPASPINWLRLTVLVQPDQRNAAGRRTEAQSVFGFYDGVFHDWPTCAGAYLDGTSGACTVTHDYRRDHFPCFSDPFQYLGSAYRPCASGKAAVIRWVQAFKRRYPGKLAFGNVWASNAMFPMCMALDVCGYESSRWWDLEYADYYRAAAYHKPGLLLNYFRIGQNLDTRQGGERFFRYATAYGLFPSIGRFTDEAFEKLGDLQHAYVPVVKRLFRAGWEPVTWAEADDPAVRVQRYGARPPMYFTLLNPGPAPREAKLTVDAVALGLKGQLRAVEMVTSAALPLTRGGGSLATTVALGPDDVAVVALLPADGVAAWYRGRAAESLQGAAYVYAQTPPTVEAAAIGKRVAAITDRDPAQAARAIAAVRAGIARLQADAAKLPDDLKRRSYLREVAEADRLLGEALLAGAGADVGWAAGRIAPVDGEARLAPEVTGGAAGARARMVGAWPGWLVEAPASSPMAVAPDGALACPPERALTALAEVEFTDAAGAGATVRRLGHAYFGPVCELTVAPGSSGGDLAVRLRNCDGRAREYTVAMDAPAGVTVQPPQTRLRLAAGEGCDVPVAVAYAADLPSGAYTVAVTVRTDAGAVAERREVALTHILPLEAGDLALREAGGHAAVDSAYYAYDERPVNDGVVSPVGQPFNEAAWASAEAPEDHWAEVQWPAPRTVARAVIYWNVENGVTWTPRRVLVQAREGEGWRTVAEVRPAGAEPVTVARFAPATTAALRLLQAKGEGPATRPNLMWLRELAVYGP
jgi:hypothetical protein